MVKLSKIYEIKIANSQGKSRTENRMKNFRFSIFLTGSTPTNKF